MAGMGVGKMGRRETMNTTLLQTEWEACVLEPARDAAVESMARRAYGMVPPNLRYLAHAPWVARANVTLSPSHGLLVELDYDLEELVSMVVSQENSCRFCFAISRYLLRVHGMSEARIAELQARLSQGTLDARTNAAVAYARGMSRSQPLVGAAERRMLREAGLPDGEVRELAYVVAYISFANRITTIPAIPPHEVEQLPDRWFFPLLRPLMAKMSARHRRRGQRMAPQPARSGPYAGLIAALGDSPIAGALAQVLDDMWQSALLTRRCKALLIAVVATGLGCQRTVDEVREVLREEGLSDDAAARALAHLQAPELDAIENQLLPFARDTIWYQPAPVQRRARELGARLTPAQMVEAFGVLSLANALCRLAPAVQAPE
jgi:AhpD family alkylhydroperoxidase